MAKIKRESEVPHLVGKYAWGKVAVFIDAANILYSQQSLGWQVDYKHLIEYLSKLKIVFAGFYYGMVKENQGQAKFFQMLTDRGYTVRTKPVKYIKTSKGVVLKGNLDVELVCDLLTKETEYDTCILLSGDSDFEIAIKHLREKKKRVVVISTKGHVAIELIRAADKYIDLKKLREVLERR